MQRDFNYNCLASPNTHILPCKKEVNSLDLLFSL